MFYNYFNLSTNYKVSLQRDLILLEIEIIFFSSRGKIDCSPSDKAFSGHIWDSITIPSAPAATEAKVKA